jgi:hypothetical protein
VRLAAGFSLLSIPGEAIWQELVGIDLTARSPPHLLLAATSGVVTLSALALLARLPNPTRMDRIGMVLLLGPMLNVFLMVGTLEWQLRPGKSRGPPCTAGPP